MTANCSHCNRPYVVQPGNTGLRLCPTPRCESLVDADPLGNVVRDPDTFLERRAYRGLLAQKAGWIMLEDGTLDKCVTLFDRDSVTLQEISAKLALSTWHIVNDSMWTDEERADIIAELFHGPLLEDEADVSAIVTSSMAAQNTQGRERKLDGWKTARSTGRE